MPLKLSKIPTSVDAKKLAKLLDSVAIHRLPEGSAAAKHARAAEDGKTRDTYLRGKELSEGLFQQLKAANGETGETLTLKNDQGELTPAGKLLQALHDARAGRDEWFAPPKKGMVLNADFRNVDMNVFRWNDSSGQPVTVTGVPSSELTIYWADQGPDHPAPYVAPSREVGVLYHETGADVDLSRAGNLSASDRCANVKTKLDQPGAEQAKVPEKLKLKNVNRDPSTVRRAVTVDFYREALKIPAQRVAPAKWFSNGEYQGYRDLEEPLDLEMWKASWEAIDPKHEVPDKVWIFKAQWQLGVDAVKGGKLTKADLAYRGDAGEAYRAKGKEQTYGLENAKKEADEAYGELATFVKTLNGIGLKGADGKPIPDGDPQRFNTAAYREAMERSSDPYSMLRALAGMQLTGAWDNLPNPSNYALTCEKTESGQAKWYFLPIDPDSTWGMCWNGQPKPQDMDLLLRGDQFKNAPVLWKNLLANDHFKAYYLDCVEHLLDDEFQPEKIQKDVLTHWQEHRSAVFQEGTFANPTSTGRPFSNDQIAGHVTGGREVSTAEGLYAPPIRTFVEWRSANARWQLENIRAGFKAHAGVDFASEQLSPR